MANAYDGVLLAILVVALLGVGLGFFIGNTQAVQNSKLDICSSCDWYDATFALFQKNNCTFIGTLRHYDFANRSNEYDYLYCEQSSCIDDGYCKLHPVSLEYLRNATVID